MLAGVPITYPFFLPLNNSISKNQNDNFGVPPIFKIAEDNMTA
jgi:hypothetical protein